MKLISRLLLLSFFALAVFTYILPVEATSTNQESTPTQQDEIIVNGTKINSYPIIINDCTLVPARDVCKNLGFTISWDSDEQTATINSKNWSRFIHCSKHYCPWHDCTYLPWFWTTAHQ